MGIQDAYKILLVDDEEEVRTSIIKKIEWEKVGFTVIGDAENGLDALEKIEQYEPDVVLTDIRMPYMDGLQLAEEIRRTHPSMRIIIFSGYDDFEYAKQAISLKITEYILKPVNAKELMEILEGVRKSLDEEIERLRGECFLRDNYQKSLDILRENFLSNLAKGKVEPEKIDDAIREYDLPLSAGESWVAIKVHVAQTHGAGDGVKDDNLLKISLRSFLDQRLGEFGAFASFHRPSGLCAIVALEQERQLMDLMAILNDVCRECHKVLHRRLTIGVGSPVRRLEQVEVSYNGAREAVSYGGMVNDVVYINDVEPARSPVLKFEEKDEAILDYALRFGDEDTIFSCVEGVMQKMQEQPTEEIQGYLIGILNTMLKVVQKHELEEQHIFGEYADYYGVLSHVKTPEDLASWLTQACSCINGCLVSERVGTTRALIQSAKNFIEENYQNSSLSLEMVCDHLHMSAPYFSTVFKREVGESYTSFLTGVRLKKAVELLKNTEDKTYIIAAKVGYDEANYFSYVFKKRFGVSPNKFRGK